MTNPEDKPKEISSIEAEKPVQTSPEKTPTEIRKERLTQINQELSDFSYQPTSPEEIQQIQGQRKQEYQSQLTELETGLETGLSEESREMIYKNMVDSEIEQAQKENERFDRLHIQKTILENIESKDFRKKISPTESENLTEEAFEKALDQLLDADIDLPRNKRVKLFRQTLEYYASEKPIAKLPIWHSTSSYALLKSLDEGFEGGHGDYSGEHSYIKKSKKEIDYRAQAPLSVSYDDHPVSELSQQMYAKLSCRADDLSKFMPLDYEKITNNAFIIELIETLKNHDINGLKRMIALRRGVEIEDVTDEEAKSMKIPKEEVDKWKERAHAPNFEEIRDKVLPGITNVEYRGQLEDEAQHSFPCFVTFEADNLKENLTRYSRGKHEAHLPYEDHYWGNLPANQIREIRVPETQIKKTKEWLQNRGLSAISVAPLEIFEVKRLIENNIKK